MNEEQKILLYCVGIYFIIKLTIYGYLYVALHWVEKIARKRHEKLRQLLKRKREEEKIRWHKAYQLYDRKRK